MAGRTETLRGGGEAQTQKIFVRDRVNDALKEAWGIDTNLEDYEEELKDRFLAGGEPKWMITVDSEGNLVDFVFQEEAIKSEEGAEQKAKLAAPGLLRNTVRKELEEEGVGKLTAAIVASVAAGASSESITQEYGLQDESQFRQRVDGFLGVSERRAERKAEGDYIPYPLNHVFGALEQLESRSDSEEELLEKLSKLAEVGINIFLPLRLFPLSSDQMEKIRSLGFNLLGKESYGEVRSVNSFLPQGLTLPKGLTLIVDLNKDLDGREPEAARLVLMHQEKPEWGDEEETKKIGKGKKKKVFRDIIGLLTLEELERLLGKRIE